MVPTLYAKSARTARVERSRPFCGRNESCFTWSSSKIRTACVVLAAAAAPAAAGFAVAIPFVQWLCLAWLVGLAVLLHRLSRHVLDDAVVLSIDKRGILDRRLMSRRIEWQEIEAICPVNSDRSHVVDMRLRWPQITLAGTRWPVRIGAHCQSGYGVPAVTISLLFLECNASDLLDAIDQHRPDLLHCTNRRAGLVAKA
jgi:hypothetical protein